MHALLVEIGDGFMTEQPTGCRIFFGMTLLIATNANVHRAMWQLLDVVMAITARHVPMYRLGKFLRRHVIGAKDPILGYASHAGIFVTHQTGFIIRKTTVKHCFRDYWPYCYRQQYQYKLKPHKFGHLTLQAFSL
jgi:hypothetical protein